MSVINSRSMVMAGLAVALSLTVAGCSSVNAPKQDQGLVAGAVAGGVLGSAIGRSRGHGGGLIGGVVGAVAGGLVGSEVGRSMDDRDRAMAQRAEFDAFAGEAGRPVTWRNADNGRYGEVVPGPYYRRGYEDCRDYTHTVYIDGRPRAARGLACRNPDGSWRIVS